MICDLLIEVLLSTEIAQLSKSTYNNKLQQSIYLCDKKMENLTSKLKLYKLIPYLVDKCINAVHSQYCQMLEKNVLSWASAGSGSVLFTHQVAIMPPAVAR